MASDVTTPATLTYSGGTLRTSRLVPARLRYTASTTLVSSKDSTASSAVAVPELDRLLSLDRLLNEDGTPTIRFMSIWQSTMLAIEAALEATNAKVDDNSAILARLVAAETLAQAANDNATAAVATAETVKTATAQTFADVDPVFENNYNERLDEL